jgi:hypothetical protein
MTRTQQRLAELEAIRDRSLTDDEQREVTRLDQLYRQCQARRHRYQSDPTYRQMMIKRSVAWKSARYNSDPEYRETLLAANRARWQPRGGR